MTPDEALARLRRAGVAEPGWHLRKLEGAGGDLATMVERVCAGEPVHRVIGRREFHGLDLALGPATLEPRDDTETLVELVLEEAPKRPRFADLGTGPGTVGLALLSELPGAEAVLTDVSNDALEVARTNARALGLTATFATGDWCEPLEGVFDFIVSNPPYIASSVVDMLEPGVLDHDPRPALDGGADGLDAYRAILSDAAAYLEPGGFLALEIGYDQADDLRRLAGAFSWRVERVVQDLGGRDRAVLLRPNGG